MDNVALRRDALRLYLKRLALILLPLLLLSLFEIAGELIDLHADQIVAAARELPEGYWHEYQMEYPDAGSEAVALAWREGVAAAQREAWGLKLISLGVQLLGLLVSPWLTLGLYTGMLAESRGGEMTVKHVFCGLPRWKTALFVDVQITLRTLGWLLLALLGLKLLSYIPVLGPIAGLIGYTALMFYAAQRYALAHLHLADEEGYISATDCITYSVIDVKNFGLLELLSVLWVPMGIEVALDVVLDFFGGAVPVVLECLAGTVIEGWVMGCCVMVYLWLRAQARTQLEPTDGEKRAKALARGEAE